MNMPVGVLVEGTVIEVLYPYYDKENAKLRPAVIVDKDEEMAKVVLLKVTTADRDSVFDIPLRFPKEAGLKEKSKVRVDHILTVPITDNYKVKGHLNEVDYLAVKLFHERAMESTYIEKVELK